MRLTLPMPPSVNKLYKPTRNGRIYKSEAAKVFAWEVAAIARAADVELLTGDVAVTLWIYVPRKNSDIDNRIKVTLDSLQGLAYHNDNQITDMYIHKRKGNSKTARIEVEVSAA